MTPQERQQFNEMRDFIERLKQQQISYPLDPVSRMILEIPDISLTSTDTTALTQVYTDSRGDTVTGPKAYTGAITLRINGTDRRFPIL